MALNRLLGTWSFTVRHVDVPQPVQGEQRYERVLDGAFVLLRWTYDSPLFPDALALLDERTCSYFDVRGVVRTYALTVTDEGWSMVRRDPDFWQRSAATFVGDDAMEGTGENSFDGGRTWRHDVAVSYVRTA